MRSEHLWLAGRRLHERGAFQCRFWRGRILLDKLPHNTIVQAAQSIIERNAGRIDKRMISSKAGGAPIRLHQVWGDQDEATFVAQQAKRLVESGAVAAGFREISVMYRTNQQSRIMEEMFVRNGVPYQLIGATKFYERREVKDLLAYLRVLANPDDAKSLLRIINVPTRGIGKATLEAARPAPCGAVQSSGADASARLSPRICRGRGRGRRTRSTTMWVGAMTSRRAGAGAGKYGVFVVILTQHGEFETALQNMPAGGVKRCAEAGARGGLGGRWGGRGAALAGTRGRRLPWKDSVTSW